jgi:hypothetical protein
MKKTIAAHCNLWAFNLSMLASLLPLDAEGSLLLHLPNPNLPVEKNRDL